eukprot:CAMPEP_0170630618 /NCGR_PEP_ID=MMETSP0224-20130122/34118_1 /TAXON_ID=285029 /ORGANISM="Togula jolla, Strain CCCM 725" /LENGTH=155 /DNA_ID=CAMNT_0010958731 /DNA_START=27 /DNA_END=491 /DNA_ORIENTATION=-
MTFERTIKVEQIRNNWGYMFSDDDCRNSVLVRAITLFLAQKDLKFKKAVVSLTKVKEEYGYCDDNEDEDKDSRSEGGQLKKHFRVTRTVPDEQWMEVEPGVMYMRTSSEDENGEKSEKTTKKVITISIMAKSEARVDQFITDAYTWYLDELSKMQ